MPLNENDKLRIEHEMEKQKCPYVHPMMSEAYAKGFKKGATSEAIYQTSKSDKLIEAHKRIIKSLSFNRGDDTVLNDIISISENAINQYNSLNQL